MKNIVICCDGTGNQIERNLSNVLKLFRITTKNQHQCVFYDPGIGTIGVHDEWGRIIHRGRSLFSFATGHGLDNNILDAYRFLVAHYESGDDIYLFGFSRGAYTVRALAGFIHMLGLLRPQQLNLCGYALAAYKQASENDDLSVAWHFGRVAAALPVRIRFLGVWDTVQSVIVPRSGLRFSFQKLPYTRRNPSVSVFRHAIAIDERRRMFRVVPWQAGQNFVENPFDRGADAVAQDAKEVWFAGVHSDIGGGYPESESGLSKFPLLWMLDEAVNHGLKVNRAMLNHLARGEPRQGSTHHYVSPNAGAMLHDSMTPGWRTLEYLPKAVKRREWPQRKSMAGYYLPQAEPRPIAEGALLHHSVLERHNVEPAYRPENLPASYDIEQSPG